MFFAACGGDGTVGWILSVMDEMDFGRPRPAIGIIPLGTGNDLSRSLNWGGKFRDKPLRKVLIDIKKADVVDLDRWSLTVTDPPAGAMLDAAPLGTAAPSSSSSSSRAASPVPPETAEDRLPLNVLNNYFSVGIDAHIALQFHRARNNNNNNPDSFKSRTRNLLYLLALTRLHR